MSKRTINKGGAIEAGQASPDAFSTEFCQNLITSHGLRVNLEILVKEVEHVHLTHIAESAWGKLNREESGNLFRRIQQAAESLHILLERELPQEQQSPLPASPVVVELGLGPDEIRALTKFGIKYNDLTRLVELLRVLDHSAAIALSVVSTQPKLGGGNTKDEVLVGTVLRALKIFEAYGPESAQVNRAAKVSFIQSCLYPLKVYGNIDSDTEYSRFYDFIRRTVEK